MQPGYKATGNISFQVPMGAKLAKLRMTDQASGGEQPYEEKLPPGSWRFKTR